MDKTDCDIRQAIIDGIEHAFRGVQRGRGITLHQARVLDDYGTPEDEAEARTQDADTRWQDVPDLWIEEFGDTLSFFDPEGFHYYIPAFMIWALRHYDTSESFAGRAAVYAFGVNPLAQGNTERFQLFDRHQARAVARFLDYFAHHADDDHADAETAQRALDAYWQQFL